MTISFEEGLKLRKLKFLTPAAIILAAGFAFQNCSRQNADSSADDAFLHNLIASLAPTGEYDLSWYLPVGGGPLSKSSNFYFAQQMTDFQMDCSTNSSVHITPVRMSLTAALSLPSAAPQTNILVNGQIRQTAADGSYDLHCVSGGIQKDRVAADGTVLYSLVMTTPLPVPLTGMLEDSPQEVLASFPAQDWIDYNYLPVNARWSAGAAYVKHEYQAVSDYITVTNCPGSQTTSASAPAPCGSTQTLEQLFPISFAEDNKPTEWYQLTDGQISTVQGVRAWVSNAPLFGGSNKRIFFELNGSVYYGTLVPQGPIFYEQADGSVVSYIIFLNAQAVVSFATNFISAGAVGTEGAIDTAGISVDLFGIGGHSVNGAIAPVDLQSHYDLPADLDGSGQTIAVVDAPGSGDYEAELKMFSQRYGLPVLVPCPSSDPCFKHIDLSDGAAIPKGHDWGSEPALDLQAAHAVAPKANLILVTAKDDSLAQLNLAIARAAQATSGGIVSMSFGGSGVDQTIFQNNPGVVFLASTGDSADYSRTMDYPAASPYVTAVGGTRITSVIWSSPASETAWSFTSSGKTLEPMPVWQSQYLTPLGLSAYNRAAPDVAALADAQHSAFAIFYKNAWRMSGGTSLSAPLWAGFAALYGQALANQNKSLAQVIQHKNPAGGGFNALLYQAKTSGGAAVFHDVVTGSNNIDGGCYSSLCQAGANYNSLTGLGTPDVTALITTLLTISN